MIWFRSRKRRFSMGTRYCLWLFLITPVIQLQVEHKVVTLDILPIKTVTIQQRYIPNFHLQYSQHFPQQLFFKVILLMEEILHQLRLVVYPVIYSVLCIPGGCLGFLSSTVGNLIWITENFPMNPIDSRIQASLVHKKSVCIAGGASVRESLRPWRIQTDMSHEKNPPTFHYTGWLIRILIMVYYNPYTTG